MPDIELQLARPPPPSRLRRGQEAGWADTAGGAPDRGRRLGPGRSEGDIVEFVLREIAPRLPRDPEPVSPSRGGSKAGGGRPPAFGRLDIEDLATLAICPDCDPWPIIEEALRTGVAVEAIFEDLLAPAARRLGALWDEDDCDFFSVTSGAQRLQVAVRKLSLASRPAREGPARALFLPAPGETHVLGLTIARTAFERCGWGTDVADGSRLCPAVRRRWFDLVAFSVSCDRLLAGLADAAARVRRVSRNRNVFLLAGGPAVASKPELAARIGVDAVAATPHEAVVITRSLLRRSERREAGGR